METITHICDVCKQSKSKEDLARLEVRSTGIEFFDRYTMSKFDICIDCLKKKNFIVEKREDKTTEEIQNSNRDNLRNKIIDILQDLDVQFYE